MHAPSLPAQIHVPDLAPPPALRARAASAARQRTLGAALVVGAAALVAAVVTRSPHVVAVIPVTWATGLALAFAAGRRAALSHAHVDDAQLDRARALLFAGVALLGPLTLHTLLQPQLWAPSPYIGLAGSRAFGEWIRWSLILTGPAHVLFALLCAWRGHHGRADGPRLVVIGAVATVAATYTLPVYGVFAALPAVYVAATSAAILRLLQRLEARSAAT